MASVERVLHGLCSWALTFGDVDIVKDDCINLGKFNRLRENDRAPMKNVGLHHVQVYIQKCSELVENAVNNPGPNEHDSFYNFLLNHLVKADDQCGEHSTHV